MPNRQSRLNGQIPIVPQSRIRLRMKDNTARDWRYPERAPYAKKKGPIDDPAL